VRRQTVDIQRCAAKDILKSVGKTKMKRSRTLIAQSWNKKQKSENFLDNVGAYQKAPIHSLSSVDSKGAEKQSSSCNTFCPIDNLGATCWLNATIQSICAINMAKSVLNHFENAPIAINKTTMDDMKDALHGVIKHIIGMSSADEKVPKELVKTALNNLGLAAGDLGLNHREQQDANEFYMKATSPMAMDIGERLNMVKLLTCLDCGNRTEQEYRQRYKIRPSKL
jgi:uncharacterized UBP type Zn finger protein